MNRSADMFQRREKRALRICGFLILCLFLSIVRLVQGATVDFAGQTWDVREWYGNPGPNSWSTNSVWVDTNGYLHLEIKEIDGTWYSGEVISTQTVGYGEYRWEVAQSSRPTELQCGGRLVHLF